MEEQTEDVENTAKTTEKSEIITKGTEYLHSWHLAVVITSLCLGNLLMALDVNIINVAIPEITTYFSALNDVAWYGSSYLLTITAFQPSFGTLYRFFDIDTIYKICILLFEGR